jgi:hypothetical protein
MSNYIVKFATAGHSGMVRITVDFAANFDTQLVTYVHRNSTLLSEQSYLWRFASNVMTLHPKYAYNAELLTKEQKMKGLNKESWQPDYLFVMFTSKTGT